MRLQVERHHGRVPEFRLEQVFLAKFDQPAYPGIPRVVFRLLDKRRVDLNAGRSNAEPFRRGDRNASIARSEVVQDVVLANARQAQHLVHDVVRRRHVDHVHVDQSCAPAVGAARISSAIARLRIRAPASIARDRHALDQDRAAAIGAAHHLVAAHGGDAAEHVLQVACHGDLLHRIRDLTVLHPEARRAARVVPCQQVHALPHHFRHQEAFAQQFQHAGQAGTRVTGSGSPPDCGCRPHLPVLLQSELARRVAAEEIALQYAVCSPRCVRCVATPSSSKGELASALRLVRLLARC